VTFYIGGRVGFGIAQTGCFSQGIIVACTSGFHRIQDEVGGAVDNAGNTLDMVTSQGTTQHTYNWNSRRYCCFIIKVYPSLACCFSETVRVCGNQCLISSNDRLPSVQSCEHQFTWVINTADNFDNKIDIIARNECACIISDQFLWNARALLTKISHRDATNFNWPSKTVRAVIGMLGEETNDLCTHGAEAQQCNAYRLPFTLAGAVKFLDGRRHAYSPKLHIVGFLFHSMAILQNERSISALGLD